MVGSAVLSIPHRPQGVSGKRKSDRDPLHTTLSIWHPRPKDSPPVRITRRPPPGTLRARTLQQCASNGLFNVVGVFPVGPFCGWWAASGWSSRTKIRVPIACPRWRSEPVGSMPSLNRQGRPATPISARRGTDRPDRTRLSPAIGTNLEQDHGDGRTPRPRKPLSRVRSRQGSASRRWRSPCH